MKSTHKTIRFDYSKIESKEDLKYWGLHSKKSRLHIDTKRYKKMCDEEGINDFLPDGLFKNRSTPYFIPGKINRHDYKINIFTDLINNLKNDWFEEYKEVLKSIKSPSQVQEEVRQAEIQFTSNSDDLDAVDDIAIMAMIKRTSKYRNIISSLCFQFIQRICVEVHRSMLIVITDLGYKRKDFNISDFLSFSINSVEINENSIVTRFSNYDDLMLLNSINNFLKHNSMQSYRTLKNTSSQNVRSKENGTAYVDYSNGMYAGNWIIIDEDYIDSIFDKLIRFFSEYCKTILKENIEEADWNYDMYFRRAYIDLLHWYD